MSLASAICYPLILAKTRMQWKSPTGKLLYRNMTEVFTKTIKRSGVQGLYVGLQARERFRCFYLSWIAEN